ncbi:MAG TPA: hypothetical protein PLE99_14415 [Candidatus Thiothrix moscowensis]|uniref:hypothetical protein n=1 Tax=unclassified Thiothrix TaxID=2636184 RepID=UPI0025D76027|nr:MULTISPECIES: hypothetical protein [unclassified Thiothrix]HRJ53948.1 hypothetical protein [Candidatus Thiothrix moscowensis]HRJ94030.1 hypothetical protein [Candidatus Thiothrix moscowensis]
MRQLPILTLLLALLVGGCNTLPDASDAGLQAIAPNIYVEPAMDTMTRTRLIQTLAEAERAISTMYGSVRSRPPVYACVTANCYIHLGGTYGSNAEALDDRILLSPAGLNWHFIAHEWAHVELFSRMTPRAWQQLPQWFNEGLAVAISQEPEYSENAWQYLLTANLPRPGDGELQGLRTLPQWMDAVNFYQQQVQARQIAGGMGVSPVYTAAGHAVRNWLATAGNQGLLVLIQRMNAGEPFAAVYPVTPR